MFGAITILSLVGLLYWIWRTAGKTEGGESFLSWIIKRTSHLFISRTWTKTSGLYTAWRSKHYPGPLKWIFFGLTLGFGILVISGFLFSLLGLFRLRGIPLILHMGAGGLFAVTMAAMLWIRAGDYGVDRMILSSKKQTYEWHIPFVFWLFILSGFFLLATALAMMLPLFSNTSIRLSFNIHRYTALVSLLSSVYLIFLAQRQEDR